MGATRTLLFDFARLDGTGTGQTCGEVYLALARPQQDNATTITTQQYPVRVDGPTEVEVPVTAPGNALVISWPPGASDSRQTWHLIPEGEGVLVAAELPRVDKGTLAPSAPPEAAWWAALRGVSAPAVDLAGYATEDYVDAQIASIPGPALSPVVDEARHTLTFQIGA